MARGVTKQGTKLKQIRLGVVRGGVN